jgi:hypothetical protein
MTRLTCPSCRLRFPSASAATLTTCPCCAGDLREVTSAGATLGFRLFEAVEPPLELPLAVELALPLPGDPPTKT